MIWGKKLENAKKNLRLNYTEFKVLSVDMSSLERRYSGNLIDARERQGEILKTVLGFTAWNLLISKKEFKELQCFAEEAPLLVSYMDRYGKLHEVTLDEARKFKYPGEDDEIEDEKLGQTCFSYYERVSVDYFIKESIREWIRRLNRYSKRYLNFH